MIRCLVLFIQFDQIQNYKMLWEIVLEEYFYIKSVNKDLLLSGFSIPFHKHPSGLNII